MSGRSPAGDCTGEAPVPPMEHRWEKERPSISPAALRGRALGDVEFLVFSAEMRKTILLSDFLRCAPVRQNAQRATYERSSKTDRKMNGLLLGVWGQRPKM